MNLNLLKTIVPTLKGITRKNISLIGKKNLALLIYYCTDEKERLKEVAEDEKKHHSLYKSFQSIIKDISILINDLEIIASQSTDDIPIFLSLRQEDKDIYERGIDMMFLITDEQRKEIDKYLKAKYGNKYVVDPTFTSTWLSGKFGVFESIVTPLAWIPDWPYLPNYNVNKETPQYWMSKEDFTQLKLLHTNKEMFNIWFLNAPEIVDKKSYIDMLDLPIAEYAEGDMPNFLQKYHDCACEKGDLNYSLDAKFIAEKCGIVINQQ